MKFRWRTLLKRNETAEYYQNGGWKNAFRTFQYPKIRYMFRNFRIWQTEHTDLIITIHFYFQETIFTQSDTNNKKKSLRKSCLDCWFFCILKPSTEFFRFEKIARLKIHPAGKNNFNASSKSSTTPYDRWVQAILHKDCRVETRNKNHDEGPHKSPDAAKFHQCWNNWSRWSIIITQPYLFDLAVGSTRTVTLTSLLVNRHTLLDVVRGFGSEVRALNTDVSSGAP